MSNGRTVFIPGYQRTAQKRSLKLKDKALGKQLRINYLPPHSNEVGALDLDGAPVVYQLLNTPLNVIRELYQHIATHIIIVIFTNEGTAEKYILSDIFFTNWN